MATLVFQAAGAALGSVFGPVGAAIGQAAGALAGGALDRALFAPSRVSGARLATARIPGAEEGAVINRLYGTARIGGTLIWATRFEENVTTERVGGKGGGSRAKSFRYSANFAVGLCEGEVALVRRVWADGRELDLTGIEMRFYPGSQTQLPDPLIDIKQGKGNAPAYRGLCYVVFDRLPLENFGNRIPLMQFEVVRPIGRLERQIRAVTVIPGSTEHGYATAAVSESTGAGESRLMNRNTLTAATDWQASMDELTALCPGLDSVALVVSWFGTDLRAGQCRVLPGVEVRAREKESTAWSVAGRDREAARLVSRIDGAPAYGGTPDDASVKQAIDDLRKRNIKVCLYPFVMMDVPAGNGLPDPYGKKEQDVYAWRGRITCHPAPGRPGSPDRSAAVRAEVSDFAKNYREMVLHYARLAREAGGVDAFLIGSELPGLTRLRDDKGAFPFVEELVRLAGEVRAILGPATRLTYGADWSEYFGYRPDDGSGDVYFNLDPLWSSAHIDAVGIDNYMPLADWRDEDVQAGNPDGFAGPDDPAGLKRQIVSGEGFDWYYASDAERAARRRTEITDGLKGKPWLFRYKDLAGWWRNPHYERRGGAESTTQTAWVPASKPFWFTELGCPAVDKGANRPNVFVDPKSAESAYPYFSGGGRSDSQQRRFLEAHHDHWASAAPPAGMVDTARLFVWTWDARPYPAFPQRQKVWSDGANWRTGHWLNGRLGTATLADVIAAVLLDHGYGDFDVSAVSGDLTGYVQAELMPARRLLSPLLEAFQVDAIEDGATLRFVSRGKAAVRTKTITALADSEDAPLWSEQRGHDSDFAAQAVLSAFNPAMDYEQGSVRSRRVEAASDRVLRCDLSAVVPQEAAQNAVEALLRDERLARRSVRFAVSPGEVDLQVGDCVELPQGGPAGRFLVTRIEDGATRRIEARLFAPLAATSVAVETGMGTETGAAAGRAALGGGAAASAGFDPLVVLMDLPAYEAGEADGFARVAAFAHPWRRMAVLSSLTRQGYQTRALLERPARIGRLVRALEPGFSGRIDRDGTIDIDLPHGRLDRIEPGIMLAGGNRIAIRAANGGWEVAAFAEADEITTRRWRISMLLRGLAGTEDAMLAGAAVGAEVVVLDAAVVPLALTAQERGLQRNWIVEAGEGGGRSVDLGAFAGGLRAHTPLSPVHLSARRTDEGVRLRWLRRGRLDADAWEASDIPLDEEREKYRVELLDGDRVLRSIETAENACLYAAADEITDFKVPQTVLAVRVRQLGRVVPLGMAAVARLYP